LQRRDPVKTKFDFPINQKKMSMLGLSIKELGRVKVHPIVAVCSLAWFSAIIPIATCPMDQKTACQLVLHCTRENNTSSSLTLVRIVRKNLTRSYPPCRVNRVSKESESASRCSWSWDINTFQTPPSLLLRLQLHLTYYLSTHLTCVLATSLMDHKTMCQLVYIAGGKTTPAPSVTLACIVRKKGN